MASYCDYCGDLVVQCTCPNVYPDFDKRKLVDPQYLRALEDVLGGAIASLKDGDWEEMKPLIAALEKHFPEFLKEQP